MGVGGGEGEGGGGEGEGDGGGDGSRAAVMALKEGTGERPATSTPDTRCRSLLSRSRVNRAVEAARRVGGGLILAACLAALNVGRWPPQRSRCSDGCRRPAVPEEGARTDSGR